MDVNMDQVDENTRRELGKSSSFYRRIYSEVEEVGWEHLVRMGEDLTFMSFRIIDKKGRAHILEITLDCSYPECPPSVSADVPQIFILDWSIDSKLKDVVRQFQQHLDKLQDFWSTLDDIDKCLWVVDPKHPCLAMSYRRINIDNDCHIMLSLNADDPRSLPEFKHEPLEKDLATKLQKMVAPVISAKYILNKDVSFPDNIKRVMNIRLPEPPVVSKNDQHTECGVCYAQYLPLDDEFGSKSGTSTDYTCENSNCSRAFHSVCLGDWLRSITTTRWSFDVLFGNCPYCSNPVAVRTNTRK